MKITNLEFSDSETAAIFALAGAALMEQGVSREEAKKIIAEVSPPNLLRLALGLEQRQRGGLRPNAGKPKKKKGKRS